ncbi:alpha-glucosidase isoform X2 [Orussus abietinus]|uniref:alpha-glucosidase isoform X2 n=1 Tax=Orussus abietinus TaxID=222816 RepID=UPI0006257806|nr:alpha-glucosidase isoform X2 [Orussus abietinus]
MTSNEKTYLLGRGAALHDVVVLSQTNKIDYERGFPLEGTRTLSKRRNGSARLVPGYIRSSVRSILEVIAMESGRVDLDSGEVNPTKEAQLVATYKPLPDDDFNWQANKEKNDKMSKHAPDNDNDDGIQEKMLKDENKVGSLKDVTEVKFISENGDAKIDIETVKQIMSGLSKEELMKYANDPFWVRLRWFLFIGFWLLWVAMLAGAIAIIVMAPKCTAPQPKKLFEESPIVRLEPADTPSKSIKGLENLLDDLNKQHTKVISLYSVVKSTVPGHTEDFKDVQPQVGRINDLLEFVKAAGERGSQVVLELDPNHSSEKHSWFERSVKKEDPFTDYYVWADGKTGPDGIKNPPNNWLSVHGGSAWEWNPERKQYYLHQFNKTQPDLNYNNPLVVEEFSDILRHWLQLGITGFRLGGTQFLTEDPTLADESSGTEHAVADDYESLTHVHTRNRLENGDVLRKWREVVSNFTNGEGLFALRDDIGADNLKVFNEKETLIDLPQSSQFLINANQAISAETLKKGFSQWLASARWPGWDLNGERRALRKRVPNDIADSLTLMSLLLPGTPIVQLNDTRSASEAFATLSKARSGSTFLYGDVNTYVINGTVFVYTRLKSGNPGFLVAYQSAETLATIDVSGLPKVPEEVTIFAHSPNYVQKDNDIQTKLFSKELPIGPKSTLVVTFVPKN